MADASRLTRILPYALLAAAAGYLYYVATRFEYHHRADTLGPDAWPRIILALLIATCLYQIVKIVLSGRREADAGGVLEDMVEESAEAHRDLGARVTAESHPWLLGLGIALTALYVAAIPTLGFFLATLAYIAAFIVLGGYRRWGITAMVSVIGTLLLLFFFMKVVYVSLPIGREPFAQVTLLLMQAMGIR